MATSVTGNEKRTEQSEKNSRKTPVFPITFVYSFVRSMDELCINLQPTGRGLPAKLIQKLGRV